jgi:hypothetical protein
MRKLSLIGLLLITTLLAHSQSPHGDDLNFDCDDCHTTQGWTMEKGKYSFTHDLTGFELKGQHVSLDCRQCHQTLVFSEARTECSSCHTDMHQQTVGFACERCHNEQSWIVNNIVDVHRQGRFPLMGAHLNADCQDCHPSASLLLFEPVGVNCIDCHQADYNSTTAPNHIEAGFSENCTDCHKMNAFSWSGIDFTHDFFPLTEGHAIADCGACHPGGDFSNANPECSSCHQEDYDLTQNPSHGASGFSLECTECHTTAPGWKPAEFKQHDTQYFPIYSGSHNGEWGNCVDCHPNPSNYAIFTCTDCHEHNKEEMDDEHDEVGGYIYESAACLECHPNGDGEGGFNHNNSNFPLTGAHLTTMCADCHVDGYEGTSTFCADCHQVDYDQSTNPNHGELDLDIDCAQCHTTAPDWSPASFDIHDNYYTLTGGHIDVANDCISCHNGDYVNTPTACNDCHSQDYADAVNPDHTELNLSIVCEECHTTNPGWNPAEFAVHNDYYPLLGAHINVDCNACHDGNYEDTPNSCFGCHQQDYADTDNPNHTDLNLATTCEDCHTINPGWSPAEFAVHNDFYPLVGAHTTVDCNACHDGNYEDTPNTCYGCHEDDYNQTTEPPHASAQFSTDCELCHTQFAWEPSTFDHDVQYFPIYSGSHQGEWESCIDCHTNPTNYSVFSCIDCHEHNQADMDDEHDDVPDYVYNSLACFDCHPTGEEDKMRSIRPKTKYIID